MKRVIGNGLKSVSVGVSTLVGAGLMGGEKMSAIPYSIEIGAGAGLVCGSLAMYAVSEWEKERMIFPILVVTGLLAYNYQYSAPAIHKLMQTSELNKIEYNYNINRDTLKNDPAYQFDKDKMELSLKAYNKIKPKGNNQFTKQITNLENSYLSFVNKKYRELVNGKYRNNTKTSWYSKQVDYAVKNNYKNISIGSGITHKELLQGKKDLAIENIAKIFYYAKLKELKGLELEREASILKESTNEEVIDAYNAHQATTKEHILEIRKNLTITIEKDIIKANSKIYTTDEISEVMKIIGIIVEIILTPFLMWVATPKAVWRMFKEWKRANRTKTALVEAKEEVLIDTLDDLLKKHNLELSLELKRVLFLVQNIMKSDLNYLNESDFKPKKFEREYGSQFPKDIALPNMKNPYYNLRGFIEFFKNNFSGNLGSLEVNDILFAYSKYKQKR